MAAVAPLCSMTRRTVLLFVLWLTISAVAVTSLVRPHGQELATSASVP